MPEVTVQQVHDLTDRIRGFDLVATNATSLPPAEPGAHIKLSVTDTAGQSVKRSYSIINPGEPDLYRIAVLREEGGEGGSMYMHQRSKPAMPSKSTCRKTTSRLLRVRPKQS